MIIESTSEREFVLSQCTGGLRLDRKKIFSLIHPVRWYEYRHTRPEYLVGTGIKLQEPNVCEAGGSSE